MQEPSPDLVMGYNLLNHFFVALFLCMMIFFFLRQQLRLDLINSFLFSIIPLLLELMLPGTLYWFQNVFFTDQAVIFPFVLYVFLEVIKDGIRMETTKNSRILTSLNIIQNIVIFYGFLTDWLFIFIALTIYIKRLIDGEIFFSQKMFWNKNIYYFLKGSLKYWFAPLLAVFLYVLQIFILGTMGQTESKALLRTAISNSGIEYNNNGLILFLSYISNAYGLVAVVFITISLVFFLLMFIYLIFGRFKRHKNLYKIKKTMYLYGMLLVPCIIQVMVFSNHSIVHDFSVLKFSVPLATIPFVLLPIMIFLLSNKSFNIKLKNINGFKSSY